MQNCVKTTPDMYLPKRAHDLPYHAWSYPLGTVYAQTLNQADAYAHEHGLGDRSEMWW